MIRFTLACDKDHRFDSWFASTAAYDTLDKGGLLSCAVCGSGAVTKALMAPAVATDRVAVQPQFDQQHGPLSAPPSPAEQALADLRRKVEDNSEYVGLSFAAEARAMHEGDSPERSIWGEAQAGDARRLIEDGVPVAPLPFGPRKRTN